MLVHVTTRCQMHCSHCMEDATPDGTHMSMDVYKKALEFIKRNNLLIIMISGGEPTEHPNFEQIVTMAKKDLRVIVLSNGLFWSNKKLRKRYLDLDVPIQIINVPEYYPIRIEPISHPGIVFDTKLNGSILPLGRAKNMTPTRMSPACYNLRAFTRSLRDFRDAVWRLRLNGKMCTPSVTVEGNIVAGESRFCHVIGTVESSNLELTNRISDMKCNLCGLEDNLEGIYRTQIGL